MAYASPLSKIDAAHQMYRDGNYEEALGFYTEALSVARTKAQTIALHSNRAACYLKLHDFKRAAKECTSVLELDHKHTGALMLRAQTLVTLQEYHSALFDVSRLMELNPNSDVYQNLEARLKTQLSLAPIPESESELEEEEEKNEAELCTHEEDQVIREEDSVIEPIGTYKKSEIIVAEEPNIKEPSELSGHQNLDPRTSITAEGIAQTQQQVVPRKNTAAEIIAHAQRKADPRKNIATEVIAQAQRKSEPRKNIATEVIAQARKKAEPRKNTATEVIAQAQRSKESPEQTSKAWQAIPKPKGHSALDYARWDRVQDESSDDDEEDDDDEECQPQYRFRVRTVGMRSVN